MVRPRDVSVSPAAFERLALAALVLLAFIIVTGASVRLTGSGLGCSDWPACEENRFVAPLEYHAMVEFVNRMITGLVSVAVVAAVLGSRWRTPRRRDLTLLSWGLVAGVAAKVLLGGLTVLLHLSPPIVMAHFLLSMVLVADAVVLHHRAGQPDDRPQRWRVSRADRRLGWATAAWATVVLVTGTVVTGAGPHGGDPEVERLPILVREATRVHSIAALALTVLAIVLAVRLRRTGPAPAAAAATALLAVVVSQVGVGYAQYLTGVPELLVAIHVLGATLVWIAALRLLLRMRGTGPAASGAALPPRVRSVVSS